MGGRRLIKSERDGEKGKKTQPKMLIKPHLSTH